MEISWNVEATLSLALFQVKTLETLFLTLNATCFRRVVFCSIYAGSFENMWQCGPGVRELALRSGDPGLQARSDRHSLNMCLEVPGSTSKLHL